MKHSDRLAIVVTVLSLVLSACATPSATPAPTQAPLIETQIIKETEIVVVTPTAEPAATAAPVEGEITISVVRGAALDVVTLMAEAFMSLHPSTKVNVVIEPEGGVFDALFAAGTQPDIIMGSFGAQAAKFAGQDVLVPLEDMPGAEALFAELDPVTVKEYYGHLYYVPAGVDITMMIYNKELFKEAGLDPEKPPQTHTEFLEAAEKIQALPPRPNGDKTYGTVFWNEALAWGGWYWNMLQPLYLTSNQESCLLLNRVGTDIVFDQPECKFAEFLDFAQKAQTYAPPTMEKNFFSGSIGMWLQYGYSWESNLAQANPPMVIGDNVGVAPVPAPQAGMESYTTLGGRNLMITKSTPERERLAWEFVKFMMTDENSLAFNKGMGLLPVKLSLKTDPYFTAPDRKPFVDMLPNAVFPQGFEKFDAAANAILGVYNQVVVEGKLTPQEGANSAAEAARTALNPG